MAERSRWRRHEATEIIPVVRDGDEQDSAHFELDTDYDPVGDPEPLPEPSDDDTATDTDAADTTDADTDSDDTDTGDETGRDESDHGDGAGETGGPAIPGVAARAGSVVAGWLSALLQLLNRAAHAGLARLARLGVATVPRLPRLIATVAGGALLCTAFPPWSWWWAAVVAVALLSWVLTRPDTTAAGGFGYGLLFGLVFYIPLLPWISGLVGAVPWLVLALVCALFPALFGLGAVLVRSLPGWPIWFAGVWALQEWFKSVFPFGGFPWGVIGFSQTDGPFLPLASLGGIPLLSAAIVLLGCAMTALAVEIIHWWRQDPQTQKTGAPPAVVLPGVCICLVLFSAVAVWPTVRRAGSGAENTPGVTVAAVQGNVPRLGLDFNEQRREVLDNHVQQTLRLAEEVHAGHAPQPQFVVWPENASDIDPLTNTDAAEQITMAARVIGAPILVGTVLRAPGWTADNPVSTNSVLVWDPAVGPTDRHDKQIVQPFGEYLPWRGFFRHLSAYADRAGYFVPVEGTGVVQAAGVPVGVATCWEIIFDRAPRESVRNGAQLLVVPTNNATFDAAMSTQQLAFAKARAVEHDRYVVVAGTTGISAVIAPDGRELGRTEFFQPAFLDQQVHLKTTLTPATRWGPAVQWLLAGLGLAALLAAMLQNKPSLRTWPPRLPRRTPPDTGSNGATDPDDDAVGTDSTETPPEPSGPDRGAP
ncbi:apolipoprotein N-acyltransferase [Mycolicibacillus trivialis]|uniref:apolipoprotein N-acyltransferase n=1 Tax=Mycolicibacillus trivialis TaxID=1798 RepID=UPI000A165DA4|nr:apolipoprotein N-acyltransferase [Mycolicibacillus trivialis]